MLSKPVQSGSGRCPCLSVTENVAVVLASSSDLSPSYDGSSKTSSKKISVLIDGVGLDAAEDELVDKLLL